MRCSRWRIGCSSLKMSIMAAGSVGAVALIGLDVELALVAERAARQESAAGDEDLCPRQGPVAARLPRELPEGPRIPARPFQRRRRLPRHRHQLDHGDAADRAGKMADRESVL